MSWRHAEAAGLLDFKRPPCKSVLLALCHHANQFTGECYPSVERLMLFTGMARRTVQLALRELEDAGFITTAIGNNRKTSLYTVTLEGAPPIKQGEVPKGARRASHSAGDAPHGAGHAPHGAGHAPEQSDNSQQNRTGLARPLHIGWRPKPDDWQSLIDQFPNLNHERELAQFVDKSLASGEIYADPIAAFRSWLRHGERFAKRDAKPSQRGGAALRERAAREDEAGAQAHR